MKPIVILISAGTEWRAVKNILADVVFAPSPYGEWCQTELIVRGQAVPLVWLHGGWGKIAAAGSTQYAIDRWQPQAVINLGTCGGFDGHIERDTIVLAERTVVYDIIEQMVDPDEAIAHYAVDLDTRWLGDGPPHPVRRTCLVSADRDLLAEQLPELRQRYGASAGDWESGAIAHVAARNDVPCVILRGVTDLVGPAGGEAYADLQVFVQGAGRVMVKLVDQLPDWLARMGEGGLWREDA